jgi:alpha-D-xyloside xylohydrolase
LFFDYPEDSTTYDIGDEFLFGPDVLVAPVCEYQVSSRNVYLPAGAVWENAWSGTTVEGGQWLTEETPLDLFPLFQRHGAGLPFSG